MRKLKVGVIVDLTIPPKTGGGYSYYQSFLNGINNHSFDEELDIVNVVFYLGKKPVVNFNKPVVFIKGFIANSFKRDFAKGLSFANRSKLKRNFLLRTAFAIVEKRNNRLVEKQLANHKIDLIYYIKPEELNLIDYPFIANHWDVAHKSTFAFPELIMNKAYEQKDDHYTKVLARALSIFCESNSGAAELRNYYSFSKEKIKVLPIFSNEALNIKLDQKAAQDTLLKYSLQKDCFFIYPAQFWTYKNHYNLLLAFSQIKKRDDTAHLKLVLSGADYGNLNYIKEVTAKLSLNDSVIFTGFVSNEVLCAFYCNAIALVMPTFLGPTNMPLIEAAMLKCPVLCSDFAGHREIMEDNALYFEPADAQAIERAMHQIINDDAARVNLIEAAYTHINQSKFNLNKSLLVLNELLLEIKPIRMTWDVI